MLKAKLFAVACLVGLIGLCPRTAIAADTDTGSKTISEKDSGQKDRRSSFEEKMQKAAESWNALTKKQKDEIYNLLENSLKSEIKVMDKLVEYGVIGKEDAAAIKANMTDNLKSMKESGEFPFYRQRSPKSKK
jgi:ribosomal protein S20